jgi:hypothetical protein
MPTVVVCGTSFIIVEISSAVDGGNVSDSVELVLDRWCGIPWIRIIYVQ